MPYFQVDVKFPDHPKAVGLSDGAIVLWVRAGCYAVEHLTDGFLPGAAVARWARPKIVAEVVDAGLWEPCGSGYAIHGWEERGYPTRESVAAARAAAESQRAEWAARQRRRRARDGQGKDTPGDGLSRSMSRVTRTVTTP